MNRKGLIFMVIYIILILSGCGQRIDNDADPVPSNEKVTDQIKNGAVYMNSEEDAEERINDLIPRMSLDEKLGQMIQVESNFIRPEEVAIHYIGSVISSAREYQRNKNTSSWMSMVSEYQRAASSTRLGIPVLFGADAVHGMAKFRDSVIFPHNSGLGAANDPFLMEKIGMNTAKEMLLCGVTWNFSPSLAIAQDIRWGRSFESFSQSPERVTTLAVKYINGIQSYNIAATAKDFVGSGGAIWGTGDCGYLIDQGNYEFTNQKDIENHLAPYIFAVNSGCRTVMLSDSSLKGKKMHESYDYIQKWLKGQLGFKGLVVTGREGVSQVNASTHHDKIVIGVNSGIDMIMETEDWRNTLNELKNAVNDGEITMDRIDDAVRRILRVKFETGLFENSLGTIDTDKRHVMEEIKQVAKEAVTKSLVLLKNKDGILPLKKDSKLIILGNAAENLSIQCGGLTMKWQGLDIADDYRYINGTTILDGFKSIASKNGGKIYTDINHADEADFVVLVLSERPYADGIGDDADLSLYSGMAEKNNKDAIDKAKSTGLPVISIMVSGRPRIVTNELESWDAFVMAWLPGTEGDGVADVIYGNKSFTGTLPFDWPKSLNYFNGYADQSEILFDYGFGLKY